MKQKADIGLIGLAVMGENLVLNMESKGFTVAVYNRTVEKVDKSNICFLFHNCNNFKPPKSPEGGLKIALIVFIFTI
jgi:prephenate dehydrogenase